MSSEKVATLTSMETAKLAKSGSNSERLGDQEAELRARKGARRELDFQASKGKNMALNGAFGAIGGGLLGNVAGDIIGKGKGTGRLIGSGIGALAGGAAGAAEGRHVASKTQAFRKNNKALDKPGMYNKMIRRRELHQRALGKELRDQYGD